LLPVFVFFIPHLRLLVPNSGEPLIANINGFVSPYFLATSRLINLLAVAVMGLLGCIPDKIMGTRRNVGAREGS